MMDVNKTLSQRVSEAPEIIEHNFTQDRIVWGYGLVSEVPEQLVCDPLVSMLVKHYNSRYFHEQSFQWRTIQNRQKSFDLLINSVLIPIGHAPDNVLFEFVKAIREQISNLDSMVWNYYLALTPPIFLLGGHGTINSRKKREELLSRIDFTESEISFAQRICSRTNRPVLKQPEKKAKEDLVQHLDLNFDGHLIISSLRSFAVWYLTEWAKIRKSIHELCPDEVQQLKSYIAKNPEERDKSILKQYIGVKSNPTYLIDIIFQIVKAVNHPILTERFTTEYLALQRKGSNTNPSRAIMDLYNFEQHESKATTVDFISEITTYYTYKYQDLRYCNTGHVGELIRRSCRLRCSGYWRGSIGKVMPIAYLLGITPEEETCFAWLLASDRHQPSNIARMLPEDIEETTNSLATVLNPQSIKFRSRKVAGIPYSKGEIYKKNSAVFEAIKAYKEQVLRAYKKGYIDSTTSTAMSGPVLPRITAKTIYPSLNNHYFRIYKTVRHTFQLFICSMPGSISNMLAIEANSNHQIWLEVMQTAARMSTPTGGSAGFKTISCDHIQRQAVNNMLHRSQSIEAIPLSENMDLAVTSEELEHNRELEAANHNHSSSVRSELYLDKAPKHVSMASSTRFSARVGDEMIRMGLPLAEHMVKTTKAFTIEEARKLLGLGTRSEREAESCSDENFILEQARLQNYVVDEIGIASSNNQFFILKTSLTIALIQAKIEHIDEQIECLMGSNENRANSMIAQRLYLQLMLEEFFTKKEIQLARSMYGDYEFPMNDLLV